MATGRVWTDEMEQELIRLWYESEKRNENTLTTKKKQREWIAEQLLIFARERKNVHANIHTVNRSTLKNKIERISRKGKALLERHVRPLLARQVLRSDASRLFVDDPSRPGPLREAAEKLDWKEICRIARWPSLEVYYNFFGFHATYGMASRSEQGIFDGDENRSSGGPDCPVHISECVESPSSPVPPIGASITRHLRRKASAREESGAEASSTDARDHQLPPNKRIYMPVESEPYEEHYVRIVPGPSDPACFSHAGTPETSRARDDRAKSVPEPPREQSWIAHTLEAFLEGIAKITDSQLERQLRFQAQLAEQHQSFQQMMREHDRRFQAQLKEQEEESRSSRQREAQQIQRDNLMFIQQMQQQMAQTNMQFLKYLFEEDRNKQKNS